MDKILNLSMPQFPELWNEHITVLATYTREDKMKWCTEIPNKWKVNYHLYDWFGPHRYSSLFPITKCSLESRIPPWTSAAALKPGTPFWRPDNQFQVTRGTASKSIHILTASPLLPLSQSTSGQGWNSPGEDWPHDHGSKYQVPGSRLRPPQRDSLAGDDVWSQASLEARPGSGVYLAAQLWANQIASLCSLFFFH